jgi:hypothetical protein
MEVSCAYFKRASVVAAEQSLHSFAKDCRKLPIFVIKLPGAWCSLLNGHEGPGVGVETRLPSKANRFFFFLFCRGITIG